MATLADNKKALFDYEILEDYEAGIALSGPEVKAVKNGQINLKGSYVVFAGGNPTLLNAHISPYAFAGKLADYDPTASRRLLLKKREINYLRGKLEERGLTIVPLSVYTSGHLIKVKIGLAKGKQLHDKRETIKKRDLDREVRRETE
ncbi:MAG: SsrA-binding protein SmpB [Candidatus Magasanikbacteria bacterium]|nr:SsrA-binding protein SmpB [Candidatus Magasanikbacteria bacterium]